MKIERSDHVQNMVCIQKLRLAWWEKRLGPFVYTMMVNFMEQNTCLFETVLLVRLEIFISQKSGFEAEIHDTVNGLLNQVSF